MKGWSSQSNLTNAYGMPTNVSMTAMVVIGLANARDLLSGVSGFDQKILCLDLFTYL